MCERWARSRRPRRRVTFHIWSARGWMKTSSILHKYFRKHWRIARCSVVFRTRQKHPNHPSIQFDVGDTPLEPPLNPLPNGVSAYWAQRSRWDKTSAAAFRCSYAPHVNRTNSLIHHNWIFTIITDTAALEKSRRIFTNASSPEGKTALHVFIRYLVFIDLRFI